MVVSGRFHLWVALKWYSFALIPLVILFELERLSLSCNSDNTYLINSRDRYPNRCSRCFLMNKGDFIRESPLFAGDISNLIFCATRRFEQ